MLENCAAGDKRQESEAVNVPARQYTLEGLDIEEGDGDQLLWRGRAKHAEGDMSVVWLRDIHLTRLPQSVQQSALTMTAPKGTMWLDKRRAQFTTPRIVDEKGGTLDAIRADYDEAQGTIECTGPLKFIAQGLRAHAPAATVRLEDSSVDIKGPVVGRFEPLPSPLKPPAP